MTLRTTIDKAGRFPVTQAPCPLIHESVDLAAPRTGVLHTTEGPWDASMGVFRVHFAPHFIVGIGHDGKPAIAQLVPVGVIGAACRRHNDHAIVQIELVGNAKEAVWLPDPGTLDALASLMLVCRDEWGIPLTHPWPDGDYGRYGDNSHRHAGKYGVVPGWFGHGDMPSPDAHWDPGALAWSKVFARAHALDKPVAIPPSQGASA